MSKPTLTVAMIGYQFMGMAHSNAYRQVGRYFDLPCEVRMKTLVGRREDRVRLVKDVDAGGTGPGAGGGAGEGGAR